MEPYFGNTHLEEYERIDTEYIGEYKIEYRINILQLSSGDPHTFSGKREIRVWKPNGEGTPYYLEEHQLYIDTDEELNFQLDNNMEYLIQHFNLDRLKSQLKQCNWRKKFIEDMIKELYSD